MRLRHQKAPYLVLKTVVDHMGSSLSGGQKQRIILARALYREPNMLFFDEGTANLDASSEALINTKLKTMPGTKIMIAHREAVIKMADRVMVLQDGLIREGSRNKKDQKKQPPNKGIKYSFRYIA